MNTSEPIVYTTTIASAFPDFRPAYITWRDKDNKQIGRLFWDAGVLKFEGEMEQSAKLFFDYLADNFDFRKVASSTPTFIELSKN